MINFPLEGVSCTSYLLMEATNSNSLDLVRDSRFYFPDGNAIILVENALFNVSIALKRPFIKS
jgi:hypothetical protein